MSTNNYNESIDTISQWYFWMANKLVTESGIFLNCYHLSEIGYVEKKLHKLKKLYNDVNVLNYLVYKVDLEEGLFLLF